MTPAQKVGVIEITAKKADPAAEQNRILASRLLGEFNPEANAFRKAETAIKRNEQAEALLREQATLFIEIFGEALTKLPLDSKPITEEADQSAIPILYLYDLKYGESNLARSMELDADSYESESEEALTRLQVVNPENQPLLRINIGSKYSNLAQRALQETMIAMSRAQSVDLDAFLKNSPPSEDGPGGRG